MRARFATVAAACVVSGCLLFPSVDGLGGSDAGDAAALDGGSEAIAPTGDGSVDASDGALVDAPADAGPFCAQHPSATFCADFDESADAGAGFDSIYLTEGGVVQLDTSTFFTGPAALSAGNGALASTASAHAAVVRNTGVTPSTGVTLDYDWRVDQLASQGTYVEALAIVFESATRSSIQLNVKSASAEVGEEVDGIDGGKTYVAHPLGQAIPTGTWVHVTLTLAMTSPRSITMALDGTTVLDHAAMSAAFTSGSVDLYVGNAYSPGPSDGSSLHYDDVLLDVQ